MAGELVLSATAEKICTLTLNRPEKLNALNTDLLDALAGALQAAAADPDASVIVLRGAGRAFCSGYDLNLDDRNGPGSTIQSGDIVADRNRLRRGVDFWFDNLWNLPIPIIAQVHGYCLQGGSELALMSDLIVAADDAQIGFMRMIGVPQIGVHPVMLGIRKAKELALTSSTISGAEAGELGLVNRAVPLAELDAAAMELAGRVAAVPKDILTLNKLAANNVYDVMGFRAAAQLNAEYDALAHRTKAVVDWFAASESEGLKAALGKPLSE